MLVSVIPIGNSKGIRLPKAILEQLNIQDKLELEVEDRHLILKPVSRDPREGWDQLLATMHEAGEDRLLMPGSEDAGAFEWEW